ncbi:MAG: hypothetical protein LLG01_00505 [Planctomycetaceae bacterium]|nr:hypothetical protein [Planctomycetaceae bacterium]
MKSALLIHPSYVLALWITLLYGILTLQVGHGNAKATVGAIALLSTILCVAMQWLIPKRKTRLITLGVGLLISAIAMMASAVMTWNTGAIFSV